MSLRVSAVISWLFKVITLAKFVLTIRELNWNQCFTDKKTKLNIYHHMVTLSTELQNRSFHVAERTRTSAKCQKWKMHVQSVQNFVFYYQICKFVVVVVAQKLRRQLHGKRHIKIELCVKLSLLRLFHVDHVVQNRRSALSLAWHRWFSCKSKERKIYCCELALSSEP